MLRKIVVCIAATAALVMGTVQLASRVEARGPVDHCSRVLCIPCPDGYVLSPTKGNCCRCVPV